MDQPVTQHLIWKIVESFIGSVLSSSFCLLYTIRNLNHEICIRDARVLGSNLGHSFVGRFLDRLLMDVLNVVVESTSAFVGITEVLVVSHVLRADVATNGQLAVRRGEPHVPLLIPTVCTTHFVAAKLFDERALTVITLPDKGCGHCFLDYVP